MVNSQNGNLVRPEHADALRSALQRIQNTDATQPELEILNDEGKQLLIQAIGVAG